MFFGAPPTIFAGLRIALAVSFIVLVAAEFVLIKSGIGYLIGNSWELLQVDMMFVGIVSIGILGSITSAPFQEIDEGDPWKVGVISHLAAAALAERIRHSRPIWPRVPYANVKSKLH